MKRIVIIVLILAIILGFLYWKFSPNISSLISKAKPQGPITLTYFGLWEDADLLKPVIDEYKSKHPDITINYERKNSQNYKVRIQTQVRENTGPDIFMIHNSWLPMFISDLAPAPADVFSLAEYKAMFYPVTSDSFMRDNQIYATPIEIDGLALYVNVDILNKVATSPPKNWQEFVDLAVKMTVRDQSGVKTAGAAMGTASNVDHWSDILGLLLLQQPGVDLSSPASAPVADVLKFYTGFVTDPRRKVWDTNLPPSTQMFEEGRLGFYFAPSWKASELRVANPSLNFKVVSVPQLSSNKTVNWASFWAIGVSKSSKFPKEAWQFVKYLTSPDAEKLMYQEASKVRLFGQPYSQVSLSSEISNDPIVGAFVNQGPNYKFWYLASNTFDTGINDEMIKYWEDGINAILQGQDPQSILQTVQSGVKQVLDKYTKPTVASPQK